MCTTWTSSVRNVSLSGKLTRLVPPSTLDLMCRRQIYKGRNEIRLSKLVTEPSHSILTQSYDSRLRLVGALPHTLDIIIEPSPI